VASTRHNNTAVGLVVVVVVVVAVAVVVVMAAAVEGDCNREERGVTE
jgi:ABC-type transporter Mla subunit MlaD